MHYLFGLKGYNQIKVWRTISFLFSFPNFYNKKNEIKKGVSRPFRLSSYDRNKDDKRSGYTGMPYGNCSIKKSKLDKNPSFRM